jgi:hypothetical protein
MGPDALSVEVQAPCHRLGASHDDATTMEVLRKANDFSGATNCRGFDERNFRDFCASAICMGHR